MGDVRRKIVVRAEAAGIFAHTAPLPRQRKDGE